MNCIQSVPPYISSKSSDFFHVSSLLIISSWLTLDFDRYNSTKRKKYLGNCCVYCTDIGNTWQYTVH